MLANSTRSSGDIMDMRASMVSRRMDDSRFDARCLKPGVDLLALLNRHLSASNQLIDQLFALFGANGNRTDACQENTFETVSECSHDGLLIPQMDVPRGDTALLIHNAAFGKKGQTQEDKRCQGVKSPNRNDGRGRATDFVYLEYTILLKNVYFEYTKFYNILYSKYTFLMRGMMRRAIETAIETWAAKDSSRPLLIRGARRVGKTHVAETVGRQIAGDAFVKLDFQTDLRLIGSLFDGPTDDVDGIMTRIADYKRMPIEKESAFILLDEVQLCERALNSLRFFSGSGWRICATGSQLGVATRKRRLPFPSGVRQETMHPMTFEEFLWALGEEHMAEAIRTHAQTLEPYASHHLAMRYFRLYQAIGGMPAAVSAYLQQQSIDDARIEQREIDQTYTADMTDPDNGISGIAARKVWKSIPAQLMRSSTKKFKYSEVERGGRRAKLMEPLEWLEGAGVISLNEMTECVAAPLIPFDEEEGSFFKVYLADTGLMFYKLGINPRLWLEAEEPRCCGCLFRFQGRIGREFHGASLLVQRPPNVLLDAAEALGRQRASWTFSFKPTAWK